MKISETALPGVLLLHPAVHRDGRRAFCGTWNRSTFAASGLPADGVQDNVSQSARDVIRGIHYKMIQPQAKLV